MHGHAVAGGRGRAGALDQVLDGQTAGSLACRHGNLSSGTSRHCSGLPCSCRDRRPQLRRAGARRCYNPAFCRWRSARGARGASRPCSMELYDSAVIGGGSNGAGIARDAAGRGLKARLAEQNDFASATSSASTKLIHGGLRYLEYYEFRLVSEALAEREVMLRIAPHIIWPLEFVLPHEKHLRPAWMIRAGLFLYDHIGGRTSLPKSRGVRLAPQGHGAGLKPEFTRGFTYYDAWVDDARLVVLTLASARAHGASVCARTRCTGARRQGDAWRVTLRDEASGKESEIRARMLVNAAGPWVKSLLERELKIESPGQVRLVKGSHIVVPRIHDRRYAYILQNPDRRAAFMIPYEREVTLIGTTDVPATGEDLPPRISPDEATYLCAAASRYSARTITTDQVVWSYSGVRPLYDDGKE